MSILVGSEAKLVEYSQNPFVIWRCGLRQVGVAAREFSTLQLCSESSSCPAKQVSSGWRLSGTISSGCRIVRFRDRRCAAASWSRIGRAIPYTWIFRWIFVEWALITDVQESGRPFCGSSKFLLRSGGIMVNALNLEGTQWSGLKNFHVISFDANREGSFNSIYGDHQFSVSVVRDQNSFKPF